MLARSLSYYRIQDKIQKSSRRNNQATYTSHITYLNLNKRCKLFRASPMFALHDGLCRPNPSLIIRIPLHFMSCLKYIAPSTLKRSSIVVDCHHACAFHVRAQNPAKKKGTTLESAMYEMESHCIHLRPKHLSMWQGSTHRSMPIMEPLTIEINDGYAQAGLPGGQTSPP